MHKYLRSVGFSNLIKKADEDELIREVLEHYDSRKIVRSEENHLFVEVSKEYGCSCGITVCGEIDENNRYHMNYYFPYFTGSSVSSKEDVIIERHAGKESFAGACDDMRVGITLIFYLQNAGEYLTMRQKGLLRDIKTTLYLSGLAESGKILLPMRTDQRRSVEDPRTKQQRSSLLAAAKEGDEEAIESLTMEDISIYTEISKRIQNEDLYTVVESYFMPYGIECDQYSLMGEITAVNSTINSSTGEKLYQMTVVTNEIPIDICINAEDLMGIPETGRRFKGNIWLLGTAGF